MLKRILVGGLLTALTFAAVPASADHVGDPCSDPSAQVVGAAQAGSFDANGGYDVWKYPTDGLGQDITSGNYAYAIVADGPIKVTGYSAGSFGCNKHSGSECIETHAPHICHRFSGINSDTFFVIESGAQTGFSGTITYGFVFYGSAHPL